MKYSLITIIMVLLLVGCNNTNKDGYIVKADITGMQQDHPGKKLIETNCYICHSPTTGHDNRLGPPMIAIKKHYISNDTTKEHFINELQAWVKNPTEENAKMFGAVRRFGVMPKTPFPEETIKQIADYMFDHDIEQPEWFDAHFNEERGKGMGNGMKNGKGNGKGKGMRRQ